MSHRSALRNQRSTTNLRRRELEKYWTLSKLAWKGTAICTSTPSPRNAEGEGTDVHQVACLQDKKKKKKIFKFSATDGWEKLSSFFAPLVGIARREEKKKKNPENFKRWFWLVEFKASSRAVEASLWTLLVLSHSSSHLLTFFFKDGFESAGLLERFPVCLTPTQVLQPLPNLATRKMLSLAVKKLKFEFNGYFFLQGRFLRATHQGRET